MGTIRAVPMRHGLTLAEQLLEQAIDDPGDLLEDSWEMGRLVIGPSYRGEAESLRRCLYLALSFLNDEAPARNLHAACTPTLARLYRRFGFETVAQSVPLRGTDKSYSLIHGSLDRVLGELSDGVEQTDIGALLAARRFSIPAQHGAYL